MADSDDEGFDLIQPSLIQQLRTILDQYPDDGQVLKELIQNAEDAGATQVKFLHDQHSYGTAELYDEDLAKFQGPALYAYNNSQFTREDWKGIRLVCDSIKVEDPTKVGRFGLGFKSVFHMTDLPSLISDTRVGFIDPHGIHFSDRRRRRTGKYWRLKEDRASMNEFSNQFLPYKGIFDCTDDVFSQGFYNGTLFRFPFRSQPSELSKTLYTPEKMTTLFDSFKTDAPLILLFLQNLESVELHIREESESIPRRIFQVKIAEKCLQTVRTKRKEFRKKIEPGKVMPDSVTVSYPITIETTSCKSTEQHSFFVTNYFCGGQVSSTFKTLMKDKDLSYLPTVGVAMALPHGPLLETPTVQGHVFCFLPLPVQTTSLTGLPVHVNGFFALSQNRRYIKSPNADQEYRQTIGRRMTDKSLLWNKCLLEEAIPKAYATMILEAIKEKSVFISKAAIYKAWPDINIIDQKWKGIEEPLFRLLLAKEVVHTQAEGGNWIEVTKAIFQQGSESRQDELILQVLLSVGVPAVTVPSHVLRAVDVYAPGQTKITPPLVRYVLRKVPSCYTSLDEAEKLVLLQFCLNDRLFEDLDSLQLLPLANGTFIKFDSRASTIYITSPDHPQELFPGVPEKFLRNDLAENIHRNLRDVASEGHSQLRLLGRDHVPKLLWEALPPEWKRGEFVFWYPDDPRQHHPPKDWIKSVWRYLLRHFAAEEGIYCLEKLPLIPLSMSQTPITLTRLLQPSKIVLERLNDQCIDQILAEILRKVGVIVLNDLPAFISNHRAVVGTYVNSPTIKGVLEAMMTAASAMSPKRLYQIVREEVSTEGKKALRSFLANNLQFDARKGRYGSFLGSLPVFETVSQRFVSKQDGFCAAHVESLPVLPLRELIDISDEDSMTLARLLSVRIVQPAEILCEMVFPDIQRGLYNEEQVDKLMLHVLGCFAHTIRTNNHFKRQVQALAFVPNKRERVKASDVFDPRNETLKKIFALEDVFPNGELYTDPTVLVMLQELGMKDESSIVAGDLLHSAKRVSELSHYPIARLKSKEILHHLNVYPKQLKKPINGKELGSLLMDMKWVPRLREKPSNLPQSLPWWETEEEEGNHFFKPSQLKSPQLSNLIGSVKPVADLGPFEEVSKYFGWKSPPDIFDVVLQLRNVISSYSKDEKPYFIFIVDDIYSYLSHWDYRTVSVAFQKAKISSWMWNGDGFSSPNHLLSRKPSIDLTPYILPLPSEMTTHTQLFRRFGMRTHCDQAALLQVLATIKEKYGNKMSLTNTYEVRHDLQLSVNVLNELAGEELSAELEGEIVLPVYVQGNTYVQLEPVERCMYSENNEWLTRKGEDEDLEYFHVHPNVPNLTAQRLGVPSLTNRMLDPDELFIGEEFGQEEKLTTRLSRLLEDYTDGFAVLKELIQNADDAGATEVKFLYDERTNEDSMTCLIDDGMKGCQGPALWVYNDATFKDEDFVNITKLNEATKEHDTEKIGRFGLGFNAVYNLTDVPMVLSKNYLGIFDPHTSYLGKAIKSIRRPGIKINLNKDVKRLKKFKNQFQPFNGIFGCDLHLEKHDNSFNGTLFRFPLRTRDQAFASEIKTLWYNQEQMRELLQMFLNGARNVLLFTQNILRVGIYHMPNKESQDPQSVLMFQVTKSTSHAGILRELSFTFTLSPTAFKLSPEEISFLQQCNFLQASSKFKKLVRGKQVDPKTFPRSSMIVDIDCKLTKTGAEFFHHSFQEEKTTWLIVSSMGNGQALKFANDDPSLLPSAGTAVQLLPAEPNSFLPSPVAKKVNGLLLNGSIFCYLPLPIHTGLPVHINGAFAVDMNRRHLKEKVEDDKSCYGVRWNDILLQDSVTSAFLTLLEDMKRVTPKDGSYKFHCLWPTASDVQPNCWPLVVSFYTELSRGGHSLFSNGKDWADIQQIVFLDPAFRKKAHIGEAANKVLKMCHRGSETVIDLPFEVLHSFELCRLGSAINSRSYNKTRFFREIFFPNISVLPASLRDVLTLHALDDKRGEFYDLIQLLPCIPSSPAGNTLKTPSQLIHPSGEAASLFSPEDGRFPYGTQQSYVHPQRLTKLVQLGMSWNDLPWSELSERAENINKLNAISSEEALKRNIKALLSFMEKKLIRKDNPESHISTHLLNTKFLPVLEKPREFPLPWKGDQLVENSQVLLAPNEAFLEQRKYLVCCTEPLIGATIPENLRCLFNLDSKRITLDQVLKQLTSAVSTKIDLLNTSEYKELRLVCTELYSWLQNSLPLYRDKVIAYLQGLSFILVGRRFLPANQIAFTLSLDCSPYLYSLPHDLAMDFTPLLTATGVKNKFDEQDYILSLQDMKGRFGEQYLDEKNLQVATHLAKLLGETVDPIKTNRQWKMICLPDSTGLMRPVSELCIRDCPWLPNEEGVNFVNDNIPWPTCSKLGVKTRRQEALRSHVLGISFGQREKLTTRLKRILKAYPCEKEILKELLQNADDAQATEICFIKDPRHHPHKRVFQDSWKLLQGPALCVYNNKPFRREDIEGIRNLGEGSKGDDPNKTGQYGVGFNAVYHLTDVPTFMTKGKDVGEVLCAFDPNCRYVPNATPQEPGILINDITSLRNKFPDVFPCYLENHFEIENGTMFRFPLRTRQMSEDSQISRRPVTLEMLDTMMDHLKEELFEVLLFINNVKKITICEVHRSSGQLFNVYSVETAMSMEDEAKRKAFAEYIKKVGERMKGEMDLLPSDIPVAKVSYALSISDSLGNHEKWLIVQQVGFEKTIEKSIIAAFKRKELGMLPRGGVACLLEKKNLKAVNERSKKAYCFLPLPLETNLPVHINGHFALDHEARRDLWRDEGSGYRSDWNNALLQDVVASCYLTLLVEVRAFLKLPLPNDETAWTVTCSDSELLHKINAFERIFPIKSPADPYWKKLVDSFFHQLAMKKLRVLPVVRSKPLVSKSSIIYEVTWLPPNGSGRNKAFFNNLAEKSSITKPQSLKMLEKVLLESGFHLVAFSLALCQSFQRSGISTACISPSSVINFYKSFSSRDPLCTIGPIPCNVNETPLRDALGVILVLLYCKQVEDFFEQLPGLPLLLTKDNCLRMFSSDNPKFFSRFQDILPGSPNIFLHELVDQKVFHDATSVQSPVVKPLDIQGLISNLAETLEVEHYGQGRFVEWFPNETRLPNQRWISRVWVFLGELTMDVLCNPTLTNENKSLQIKAALGPLENWSILPSTESRSVERKTSLISFLTASLGQPPTHFLVPLCQATAVLDFGSSDATNCKLLEVLRKLGLPELNYAAISTLRSPIIVSSSPNPIDLVRLMVSSMKVPASLLTALSQKIRKDSHSTQRLNSEECRTILEYFSRSVACLQDSDRSRLKMLPFYEAIHGSFVQLGFDRHVCVLPAGIPRKELVKLEPLLRVVFIESSAFLSDLFKFLALECVSAVDVYCTYLLPHLNVFDQDTRQAHLEYISKDILCDRLLSEGEEQRLLDCLRNTPIIPTANGALETASSFYDPFVPLFRIMLPKSYFPPEPLTSQEWLVFLRRIGLIHEVPREHLIRFAREVADEAVTQRTAKTVQKSQALVKHIMQRHNVREEGILPDISTIPFVASELPSKALQAVCQPFQGTRDGQSPFCAFKGAISSEYAELVWTQAHLLPRWADPKACRYELNTPKGMTHEKYCTVFTAELQILTKPSIDLVVRHCQTVCYLHENKNNNEDSSCQQRTTKLAIMERIYEFLQRNLTEASKAQKILLNTTCILVEDGKKFILPRQAVVELYESLEIKPFLYSVPRIFGKFQTLFYALGCKKSVTAIHYAMVLEMLYEKCKNAKLHPNEVAICVKAVKGFFERLEQDVEKVNELSLLHLPGMSLSEISLKETEHFTPVHLQESAKLVLNDVPPALLDRLQTFQYPILDLRSMKVTCRSSKTNYQELVKKLPKALRPQFLSFMLRERYLPQNNTALTTGEVKSLTQRLSSPQFCAAIIRLIRDENLEGHNANEPDIENIQKGLQSIDICVVEGLQTTLFCGDSPIPQSEAKVPHFLEKGDVSSGGKWKIYLNAITNIEQSFSLISSVSNVIVELYGSLLGKRAVLVSQMLTCPLSDIWGLLDASGVRQDDSYCAAEVQVFPTLGNFIPLVDHHLLNEAFVEFETDEYVGYELEDPSLNGEKEVPTYIYAMIVEEVTDEGLPLQTKRYKINIGGGETLVVDAADLYKFHRLPVSSSSALVIYEQQGRKPQGRPKNRNAQEVFDEISEILEDAWKLPEEKHRKIIKRLYLQWHPDTNFGDEEFCTEVCKHIQSETSRLEKGEPRTCQQSSNVASSHSQRGFYDDFFHSWGARAREHRTQRDGYKSRQQFPRSSNREKNPQPGEAKRWLRQAVADITATENDIVYSKPSYEWACFKCHQAAEKALKAAQYAIDAEKTNVHNLVQICFGLEDSGELSSLASVLENLVGNSTRMRYPDMVFFPRIPNDVYSAEMAQNALLLAKEIVRLVKNRL